MAPAAKQHQQEHHRFPKVAIGFELSKSGKEARGLLNIRMAAISMQPMTLLMTG
jgi:hypothetical protein